MADVDELAGLLTSARQGDQEAFQRAQEQLSPFVHSLIIARAPHHLAGSLVRHVMVQGAMKLDGQSDARAFIKELFELARHMGDQSPGAEDLATDPLLAEGRRLLTKLRALQLPLRERLLMRLLEGLTGPELSDLLELNEEEVRASLDQALSEHLEQPPGAFKSSGYLWSMVGNPPDSLVKLENLLTPLRFDLALLTAGEDGPTDVTPVNPIKAVKRAGEGRKPTGESLLSVPPPVASSSSGGLKPSHSASALKPSQSAGGLKPSSSSPRPPSGLSGTHLRAPIASPVPVPVETTDPTATPVDQSVPGERTDATAALLSPVVVPPIAAPPQSHGTVVKTIQASDLPAAAAFDLAVPPRLSPPAVTRQAPPEIEAAPSNLNPLAPAWPSRPKEDADEQTLVQPTKVPLVTAPMPREPAPDPETTGPVNWKASKLMQAPSRPRLEDDPHMTRAVLAPVESFAPRGSVFSSYRPFVVAGTFALVAIGVVALLLSGVESRVKKGWNLVPVVVAAMDLPEGTTVGLESISQRAVPEQFVTSSVIRPDNTDYVVGQRLLIPVQAGDPMLWTEFESAHAGERLSRKIQHKSRGVSVRVTKTVAVGGWVQPNDHIDIIASIVPPSKGQTRVAVTLLQDVIVLSTGKITDTTLNSRREKDRDYQDITVLLVPEEAERLTLAARLAILKFTLRSDESEPVDYSDQRYETEISTLIRGERVRQVQKQHNEIFRSIRAAKKPRDL